MIGVTFLSRYRGVSIITGMRILVLMLHHLNKKRLLLDSQLDSQHDVTIIAGTDITVSLQASAETQERVS